MDISKLSNILSKIRCNDSWSTYEECKKLTEYAKDLLQKDDLSPCDIEVINNSIPDEHQHLITDRM